jgi:hypothetical protein
MATRITFIIRDDEAGLDPSTILDTAQQMLEEQLGRYCLADNFDSDDVMVSDHPEGAPVDHGTSGAGAADSPVDGRLGPQHMLKKYACMFVEQQKRDPRNSAGAQNRFPRGTALDEACRLILKLAATIDGEG